MNWWQIVFLVGYVWVAGIITGVCGALGYTLIESFFEGIVWPISVTRDIIRGEYQ